MNKKIFITAVFFLAALKTTSQHIFISVSVAEMPPALVGGEIKPFLDSLVDAATDVSRNVFTRLNPEIVFFAKSENMDSTDKHFFLEFTVNDTTVRTFRVAIIHARLYNDKKISVGKHLSGISYSRVSDSIEKRLIKAQYLAIIQRCASGILERYFPLSLTRKIEPANIDSDSAKQWPDFRELAIEILDESLPGDSASVERMVVLLNNLFVIHRDGYKRGGGRRINCYNLYFDDGSQHKPTEYLTENPILVKIRIQRMSAESFILDFRHPENRFLFSDGLLNVKNEIIVSESDLWNSPQSINYLFYRQIYVLQRLNLPQG